MSIVNGMRTWWQEKTGEEETPLDGFAPVWVISMLVHLVLLFILAFSYLGAPPKANPLVMLAPVIEEEEELFELTEDFTFADLPAEEVGANSFEVDDMARSRGRRAFRSLGRPHARFANLRTGPAQTRSHD